MIHLSRNLLLSLFVVLAAACSSSSSLPSPPSVLSESVTGQVISSGTFSGRNDHVVSGGVELIQQDGTTYLRLDSTFSLDGAPDPRIGFSRSGEYDTSTTFTGLERHSGEQIYRLPSDFQLGSLNEATIWCDDFSVVLGTAPLR